MENHTNIHKGAPGAYTAGICQHQNILSTPWTDLRVMCRASGARSFPIANPALTRWANFAPRLRRWVESQNYRRHRSTDETARLNLRVLIVIRDLLFYGGPGTRLRVLNADR